MKRREFLRSAAAAGLVPALPGQALASSSPAFSGAIYAKAVHYTRLWGTSVPEMYTSALGLNHDQATKLFGQLARDKIIAAPNANGIAQATAPYFKISAAVEVAADPVKQTATSKVRVKQLDLADGSAGEADEVTPDGPDDGPLHKEPTPQPEGFTPPLNPGKE